MQKIHTPLQTIQGQQASNYTLHTRSGPGSDFLCEEGTADYLCRKKIKDLREQQEVASGSSLKPLHQFIDKEGLLRVGGRLQQSTLPYKDMRQIILRSNHPSTKHTCPLDMS